MRELQDLLGSKLWNLHNGTFYWSKQVTRQTQMQMAVGERATPLEQRTSKLTLQKSMEGGWFGKDHYLRIFHIYLSLSRLLGTGVEMSEGHVAVRALISEAGWAWKVNLGVIHI